MIGKLLRRFGGPRPPRNPEEAAKRAKEVRTVLEAADAAYKSGQVDQAIKQYRKAMQLDPKSLPAYVNLGAIYSLQPDKVADAIVMMECARNLDPGNATVQLNLATLYTQQGNFDRALGVLEELQSRDPQAAGLRYTRGCVLFYQGKQDEAVTELKRELLLNPKHPHAAAFLKQLEEMKPAEG